jgi:hypothetical protein
MESSEVRVSGAAGSRIGVRLSTESGLIPRTLVTAAPIERESSTAAFRTLVTGGRTLVTRLVVIPRTLVTLSNNKN